jgi:hypothetical protein
MATSSEKSSRHGSNGHNGHATHQAHAAASHASRGTKSVRPHASAPNAAKLDQLISLGRELPQRLQEQLRSNPMGTIATVGAGAFVMGALLGSRIGRLAIAAAIPHVVERVFQGAVGDKIRSFAEEVAENVSIESDA